MKRVILRRGEEEQARAGHPWVFDNQVERVLEGFGQAAHSAVLDSGGVADVETRDKEYLGRAFVNPRSKIIARFFSRSKEGVDKGFFKRRIREAAQRRLLAGIAPGQSCRLVYAEADALPGLIVDRYCGAVGNDNHASSAAGVWFCVQFLIAGLDARRDMILDSLEELFTPRGIIEKTPRGIRELEGLPEREAEIRGEIPESGVVIEEGPCLFTVDLKAGQKTGHFLDQRENHSLAAFFALNEAKTCENGVFSGENPEKTAVSSPFRILDAFCYTGGFGLCIAKTLQNARFPVEVTCVDSSRSALETLKKNAALNGISDCVNTIEADVRDYLSSCRGDFDMVILDPPAFAKTRSSLEPALRAYTEINSLAIKLLSGNKQRRGFLVTCSCSQALDAARFHAMLAQAAVSAVEAAKRAPSLREYAFRGAPPDHPVLASYPQSAYLKASFCGVEK